MRDCLIRLGPSQLVMVAAGLLTVLCVTFVIEGPSLEDFYARAYALPRIEQRWECRFGMIRVQRNGGEFELHGIVSLSPSGRLARLGLRVHDAPFGYHEGAALTFYEALLASERGEATSFEVVNLDDWAAGRDKQAFRTIEVQPGR